MQRLEQFVQLSKRLISAKFGQHQSRVYEMFFEAIVDDKRCTMDIEWPQ